MGRGSVYPSPSRCPRVKPTVTLTSTVTSSGVSTVPTSQGFTPILSETFSVSFHPNRRRQLSAPSPAPVVISLNDKGQVTTSASQLPQSLICGPETTSPPAPLTIPSTCAALSTVTTTTTTTIASSTTYDACASNNFANQGFGKGAGRGLGHIDLVNLTSTSDTIQATTAYECCVACQKLGCAFGDFLQKSPNPYCELFFFDRCDPGVWRGDTFQYNAEIVGELSPDLGYQMFNGPCGQVVYGGSNWCQKESDFPCE
ncbi:MAG: hypothetical protein Q9219_003524 [cf. Caloplaca sp. 3 TL-2023]